MFETIFIIISCLILAFAAWSEFSDRDAIIKICTIFVLIVVLNVLNQVLS